jgi:hypothetical protein
MKRDQKNQKRALRLSNETIRKLSLPQLAEVVGGASNEPSCMGVRTLCFCQV